MTVSIFDPKFGKDLKYLKEILDVSVNTTTSYVTFYSWLAWFASIGDSGYTISV